MIRLGINGYGRIGRSVLRALYESGLSDMRIVAINEPADSETIAHLTQYDSTHGRFACNVKLLNNAQLQVNNDVIALSHFTQVSDIQWLDVDVVLECSGSFKDRATAELHLRNGAKKVLFSQPAEADVDATVVFGVNHAAIQPQHNIISNASCTTNGSVPILKLINDEFGIDCATITTIHSAMNDQPVLDAYHNTDLRKTRSAHLSMIPVDTGLAKGIERILPELTGRLSAQALRIPTVNVSAMDMSIVLQKSVDVALVNQSIKDYASANQHVIAYNEAPLASIDFNHDARSCIVDLSQTRMSGERLLKLFLWFDNEWAYANRMLDVARYMDNKKTNDN
jgi:D-erythrose 4-phosphate dehydrogenase